MRQYAGCAAAGQRLTQASRNTLLSGLRILSPCLPGEGRVWAELSLPPAGLSVLYILQEEPKSFLWGLIFHTMPGISLIVSAALSTSSCVRPSMDFPLGKKERNIPFRSLF